MDYSPKQFMSRNRRLHYDAPVSETQEIETSGCLCGSTETLEPDDPEVPVDPED